MSNLTKNESVGAGSEPRRDIEQTERKYLIKYLGQLKGRILDIGCGDGRLTRSFAHKTRSIVGIDLDLNELKSANKKILNSKQKNLYYSVAKGEALPFASKSFNQVIFSWSL